MSHVRMRSANEKTLHLGATHGGDQFCQIFGSRDLLGFPIDLSSHGDSVYSTDKSFGFLGSPMKTCLMCMGTPVKTC